MDLFRFIVFIFGYSYLICLCGYTLAYFLHGFKKWRWSYLIPLWDIHILTEDISVFHRKTLYFLSNKGEIIVHDGKKCYVQTIHGEYIQPHIPSEYNTLKQIKFLEPIELALSFNENYPEWKHLTSILVHEDYSNFVPELSNNGGKYSFHTTRHFFFCKFRDKFRFGYIDETTSSADFTITWDGQFQNDGTYIEFFNGPKEFTSFYNFQHFEGDQRLYYISEPIEKYLQICKLNDIFATEFATQIVDGCSSKDALNQAEKEKILNFLIANGFQTTKTRRR